MPACENHGFNSSQNWTTLRTTPRRMSSQLREIIHITPAGKRWEVVCVLAGQIQPFRTRSEARTYAESQAQGLRPCVIVTFGRNGREVSRESFE